MKKCVCGFKTWKKSRFIKHQRNCEVYSDGRKTVSGDKIRQAVEAEQVEEVKQDEGIQFEEMTVNELRELAKAEGMTGIYGKSKAELIEALREGE